MRKTWAVAAVLSLAACRCGEKKDGPVVDELPSTTAEMFRLLFAPRTKAKIDRPAAAVPADLDVIATSPDPEAWRAWAAERPFVKGLMETPLAQELRMSRAYLALDGLQHRAAQAASLSGKGDERGALWRGPTAVGLRLGDERTSVLVVKSIAEGSEAAIRFGAAFAMLGQKKNVKVKQREVKGVDLYTLAVREQQVVFAVFSNLLVAGDDPDVVAHAVALAMNEDEQGPAATERGLLPAGEIAGIHVHINPPETSVAQLFGVEGLGLSLVMDEAAPIVVRHTARADAGAAALLRHAPEAAWFGLASGVTPSKEMLDVALKRLGAESLSIGDVDVKPIAEQLEPGLAVILGAGNDKSPAGVVLFRHNNKKDALAKEVQTLLAAATGRKVRRTVMEAHDAILLDAGGPSAALTQDALLVALDQTRLRAALAAGAGKAPSLADRSGVDVTGAGGLYLDLGGASTFLTAFYRDAFRGDEIDWAEARDVLEPTFQAIGSGGAVFAKLTGGEGTLRALP